MIPALDNDEDIEYVWYIGDPVASVGLWKRTPEYEFPLYQNTRGKALFNDADVSTGNIDGAEPTSAFYNAIAAIHSGPREVDVSDCEWYEREFLDELAQLAHGVDKSDLPTELGQLVHYALSTQDGGDGQ